MLDFTNGEGIPNLHKGDLDHALEDIHQVVRLLPNDPQAYIERLDLLWKLGEYDRLQSDLDRIVQLLPKESATYFFRAVMTLLGHNDWDKALADMDRAITIDPLVSPSYLFRAVLNAKKARLLPTCRDFAAFLLTLDRTEFKFFCKIEWPNQKQQGRFVLALAWRSKRDPRQPKSGEHAPDINDKCIQMGLERLASATFGITR